MKRLPATGYRYLAALALRHHGALTKGRLARDIRANHTMVTKVLAGLVQENLAAIAQMGDGSYQITPRAAMATYLDQHGDSLAALHRADLLAHFQYGRRPAWAEVPPWRLP